jgi:lysophospholipase L1-like esterase
VPRPRPRFRHRLAGVAALPALLAPGRGDAADAAWHRTEARRFESGTCHELRIARRGTGPLELRLGTAPLPTVGVDWLMSGAAVLVPADEGALALALYHTSGPYVRHVVAEGPIRWRTDGRRLCVAAGDRPLACGLSAGEPTVEQRIAFGTGWETEVMACAPEAVAMQPLPRPPWRAFVAAAAFLCALAAYLRRRWWREYPAVLLPLAVAAWTVVAYGDPWRLHPLWPTAGLALGLLVVVYRLVRRRWWSASALTALLVLGLAGALTVPHPLALHADVEPAPTAGVPPLFTDAAYWHFLAPQQQLGFRERSLAEVAAATDGETWLVLGGSVTAGMESEPEETYVAIAERLLRAEGHSLRLVNAGVPGWHIGQIDEMLLDLGDRLSVRGLVLASVLNNAAFPIVGPPGPPVQEGLLLTYWGSLARNHLLLPGVSFFLPKGHNAERLRDTLDALITREQARGRRIVLLDETHKSQIEPAWFNAWLRGPQEAQRQVIREVARRHGLVLHPVDDTVAALPRDDRFLDGMHLSVAGHAAVGARLAEILAREAAVPLP